MNFSYWEKEYFLGKIDFLIVGAGLTGLQTAINLKEKEPKANVVVVDRFAWSLGASTRNAGFACFANVSEIIDDLQNASPQSVYSLIAQRYKGLLKLRDKFGDQNIGYNEKGSTEIFTNENKADLYKSIDSLQAINSILYTELGLDNVFQYSSKSHLPNMIGGITNAFEGQLNTGKLYATIFRFAQLIGIKILGGIEVASWQKVGEVVEVETEQGLSIKTTNLILCTNAFASLLTNEDIEPARGQVILSEKVENLPCEGLHFYDKGFYYWRDIDNRILLGGARNVDINGETSHQIESNETILVELKRFMNEHIFGRETKIEHEWSGIMAMGKTKAKTPVVKQLEPNVLLAARLGGMGVALSANVAEEVVALIYDLVRRGE